MLTTQLGTTSDDGRRVATTPADGATASQPDTSAPTPAQAHTPAFVLEADGFTPAHASDDAVRQVDRRTYLQTFRSGPSTEAILFVLATTADYGLGDDAPGTERVVVRGHEAILFVPASSGMARLGWREADRTVVLRSWGLDREQLLAAAETLLPRAGRPGFDSASGFPRGLAPSVEGPLVQEEGSYLELQYDGSTSVTVRQYPGDQVALYDRLDDRLDSADRFDLRMVAGRTAFEVIAGRRTNLLWLSDGLVVEVVIEGNHRPGIVDAVANGIRQVDLDRWKQEAGATRSS